MNNHIFEQQKNTSIIYACISTFTKDQISTCAQFSESKCHSARLVLRIRL